MNDHLNRALRSKFPRTHAELQKMLYLGYRAEREQDLANQWQADVAMQAVRTFGKSLDFAVKDVQQMMGGLMVTVDMGLKGRECTGEGKGIPRHCAWYDEDTVDDPSGCGPETCDMPSTAYSCCFPGDNPNVCSNHACRCEHP